MFRFWEVIRTLVHCVLSIYCSPLSELSGGAEQRFRFIQPQHIVCSFPINLERERQKLQTRAFKCPCATFVERSRLQTVSRKYDLHLGSKLVTPNCRLNSFAWRFSPEVSIAIMGPTTIQVDKDDWGECLSKAAGLFFL